MHYFTFSDDFGQHRISADEAQHLLKVSKRTMHYQHSERRDAGRWDYLTAYASGRIIPVHWNEATACTAPPDTASLNGI